jgi:hypothetical protein
MLGSLILAGTLSLAAQSGSWVVLVKSDGSVPSSWEEGLQEAVKTAANSSKVKWVPPPQVSLEDAQLALGCGGWDAPCVGQIAGMMNADAALVLEIEKKGRGAWISSQVVSSSGESRSNKQRCEVPDRGETGLQVARAVAASAVTGKPVTVLTATTDVAGAEDFVDGKKHGKTPLTLAGMLSTGSHTVEFRMEGRAPVTQKVNVQAGKVTKVGAVMATAAQPPPDDPVVGDPDPDPQGDPVTDPDPDPGTQPVTDTAAGGGIDMAMIGYITLGVAGAAALVGGGLLAGHYWVGFNAQARPCTDPAQLELPPDQRSCESQAEAYERIAREGEDIENTMNALYWSGIIVEVGAGVIALAGVGLVVFGLMTAEE